jgi:hypothetical protein
MASKRQLRKKMCTNKRTGEPKPRFPSEAAAANEARRLRERSSLRVSAFHCPFCGHWHVGMTPGQPARHDKRRFV